MAQRRMLSRAITESMPFLSMALSAQALYMHLVLNADDEGVVSVYAVKRICGASDGDLDNLLRQGFVRWIVQPETIAIITHWLEQNRIQPSRKIPSRYHAEIATQYPELLSMSTRCQQDVDTGQDSIGQDSIDQYSIGQDSIGQEDCYPQLEAHEIVELAQSLGISPGTSHQLINRYSTQMVERQLRLMARQKKRIINPNQWITQACKNGWK